MNYKKKQVTEAELLLSKQEQEEMHNLSYFAECKINHFIIIKYEVFVRISHSLV